MTTLLTGKKSFLAADGSGTSWGKLLKQTLGEGSGWDHPSLPILSRDIVLSGADLTAFSTVILVEEMARGNLTNGMNTVKYLNSLGINAIVKSDGGLQDFRGGQAGEQVTLIRPSFDKWLDEMKSLGVKGTKFRTVTNLSPSRDVLEWNSQAQVQNALACVERGLIPCLEPEVLGGHAENISAHAEAFQIAVSHMYETAKRSKLDLSKTMLKVGFVANGQKAAKFSTPEEVAEATLRCINKSVPAEVREVVFLSGGWEPLQYYSYLSAVNKAAGDSSPVIYRASASRAAFQDAYRVWGNRWQNVPKLLEVMRLRGVATLAACSGEYDAKKHEGPIEQLVGQES